MGSFLSMASTKSNRIECDEIRQNEETCKRQKMSSAFEKDSPRLIPSLPDELSLQIIARLPRICYFNLRLVSQKWKATVMSSELYKLRKELGTTEEWVYLLIKVGGDKLLWYALDPLSRKWLRLPTMPNDVDEEESRKGSSRLWMWNVVEGIRIAQVIRGLLGQKEALDEMPFCGCAVGAVNGCLYVLGGFAKASTKRCVWRFDPIQNTWSKVTSMSTARAYCKTGILNNKLYVVGGVSQGQGGLIPLQSAEVFDPCTDTWSNVPSMPFSRARFLPTAFLADMLKPIATGLTSYKAGMGEGWPARQAGTKLSVVVDGELYAFDPSSSLDSGKIKVYDQGEDAWKVVIGKVPIYDSVDSESPYLLAGFHGKLHVITKDANHNIAVLRADLRRDLDSSPSTSTTPPPNTVREFTEPVTESDAVIWRVVANRDFGAAELVSCQVIDI
ncbi:hypothetical protein L6164_016116 [Bauhinia variegata]|uniref:Uncharacterized protein n=1 Tax=Bauhinia variegata TaxID=167791 RepID=A0ACB9NME4_BAUVA|nr:hypothetical protein L6164_016116 [Bauhinia variegata]